MEQDHHCVQIFLKFVFKIFRMCEVVSAIFYCCCCLFHRHLCKHLSYNQLWYSLGLFDQRKKIFLSQYCLLAVIMLCSRTTHTLYEWNKKGNPDKLKVYQKYCHFRRAFKKQKQNLERKSIKIKISLKN